MSPRFRHYLKIVALAHVLVVAAILIVSGWERFFRPKPRVLMPIEFMVEVPVREDKAEPKAVVPVPVPKPAPKPTPKPEPKPKPTPKPEPKPEPTPKPEPKPEPTPEPKRTRAPITRSTKRIARTADTPPPKKLLSEEEIRKLLERGVQAGDHTTLPDSDTLSLESIRRAFYEAWVQPSREETDGKTVRAEISFGADGRITGRRMIERSGIAVMDDSVMRALNAVAQVDGLNAEFHKRYPSVTIAFKVE